MSDDDFKMPMSIQEIERYIPHRAPYLLIDRVVELKKGESIHAYKNVTVVEPIFMGHFPNNPILPGVYIIEGLAQCSAILAQTLRDKVCTTCLLVEIEKARFRRPVVPGDCLHYHVKFLKSKRDFLWFEGEAQIDDKVVASSIFSAKLS